LRFTVLNDGDYGDDDDNDITYINIGNLVLLFYCNNEIRLRESHGTR